MAQSGPSECARRVPEQRPSPVAGTATYRRISAVDRDRHLRGDAQRRSGRAFVHTPTIRLRVRIRRAIAKHSDTFVETYVLCGLAVILVEVDRPGEALALAGRALELASASRNRHHVATAVEAAALAEARLHLPDVAVRLWAAGQERREAIGAPIGPRDRPAHDHALNAARTNLGSDRFLAEWNTGRALTDADLLRLVVPDRTPEAATP